MPQTTFGTIIQAAIEASERAKLRPNLEGFVSCAECGLMFSRTDKSIKTCPSCTVEDEEYPKEVCNCVDDCIC